MILLALFAIGLMSMVVAQVATTEIAITSNITASARAFLPADGASQVLLRDLIEKARTLGRFPTDAELATITAPSFTDVTLTDFTAYADGAEQDTTLANGLYVGLSAEIQPFAILVTADSPGPPSSEATVEIDGEFASIPIFQFGVLYEDELDIHPGPAMTVAGRVHSNADIYADPTEPLSFDSSVVAAGGIYNTHAAGYTNGGTVQIKDNTGAYQAMAGLDSPDSNWSSEAISRWDGRVRDSALGGDRVNLVIEDPTNPRLIIEAGRSTDTAADQAAKIWYDAGLRIVNGNAYDNNGNSVSLIDPTTGQSAIGYTVIYDHREQKYMLTVYVDVDKLGRSPGFPANGIVYLGAFQPDTDMPNWPGSSPGVGPSEWSSYSAPWWGSTEFAFKVYKGSQLPGSLTFVTENPLYVHGDYNTVTKKPAAFLADAVTILSNKWGDLTRDGVFDEDKSYSELSVSYKIATSTTINAAIMTGNVDMGLTYNGGLENLPRLIEKWSSATLTLRGSLVCLWHSHYADSNFTQTDVYVPPTRNYLFENDFLNLAKLPPGTPRAYQITVTAWEHR